MSDYASEIARACYQAYVDKDRAAIEALLDEDFHFTSPLDNRLDRATYFERCWPNSERIRACTFKHLIAIGETVFVTYEGEGLDGKGFRNTEIMTIRNGKISAVEVYFGWSLPHPAPEGSFVEPDGLTAG
ncbi:Ketosteroid isomerase-related protein [Bosea sp. 62]|uniref:nuclear transport factor 2 family protein n=1 Tax=unclassified Bosea (in: a-proteobacteria) TaxID=2653178 RepID=UPI00125883C9|nr:MULTISPECIES: nuclear transport factor 2 family protein [unclassified Bosea (in: a-proteobacteria)]CAD5254198.1 Ketosteroid isomerase-related protein [Bosea sp. 21B]CAD5286429.1 Ketosteroid isomerase-related protein [Bosea sp. 7B]CAD5301335.1 Ketosteroid isomerase-related protein [Bosea sp. 46]VVT57432.1 Ketosteroid isomerase-related protein [Bosea sp. EC-HK365B]VXB68334.1 Ketosteroid isomerase-related protein [Bosea sp. 125]